MDQRDISKKSQCFYVQIILSLTKTPTKIKDFIIYLFLDIVVSKKMYMCYF